MLSHRTNAWSRRGFLRRALTILSEDASRWGLTTTTAAVIAAVPVGLALLVAGTNPVRPVYRFLTREDSLLEWTQVFCVVSAAMLLGLTARILARRKERAWAVLYGLGAITAVIVAGEEISWGQRLLGIETPEVLEDINTQGETTIHNVRGVLPVVNFVTMTGAGLLTTLPLAAAWARERGWRTWSSLYRIVPPLALVAAFAIPFAYRFLRFLTAGGTSGSFAEVVELDCTSASPASHSCSGDGSGGREPAPGAELQRVVIREPATLAA